VTTSHGLRAFPEGADPVTLVGGLPGQLSPGFSTAEPESLSATGARQQPRQESDARVAVIACGAIAQPTSRIIASHGWPVDVYPLPPLLHNRPELIAGQVETLAGDLADRYERVAVGYADCGTYGALDEVCGRLGLARLPGLHCYDVFAGPSRLQAFFHEQPGTYVLTDFLVRSFGRTVLVELGLDRYPELRDTYFGHYTRVVWLAQEPDDELTSLAQRAADAIGLPLTTVDVGYGGLQRALADLLSPVLPR
jgi:Protein of unknown function (DUF1638)